MLEWEFFRARCIRDGVWRHWKARENGNIRYNSHSKMIFPLLNSLFIFTTYLNVRQWHANKTFLHLATEKSKEIVTRIYTKSSQFACICCAYPSLDFLCSLFFPAVQWQFLPWACHFDAEFDFQLFSRTRLFVSSQLWWGLKLKLKKLFEIYLTWLR